jgi:putative membrane protein
MNLGHCTYLVWLLGWAMPVLLGQWIFFSALLRPQKKAVFGAAFLVGTFLSLVDGMAIADAVWEFSPALTLGLRLGAVPLEEVLFFYGTALLVTQSMALFAPPAHLSRS